MTTPRLSTRLAAMSDPVQRSDRLSSERAMKDDGDTHLITMPPPMPNSPGHASGMSASASNIGCWWRSTQQLLSQHAGYTSIWCRQVD